MRIADQKQDVARGSYREPGGRPGSALDRPLSPKLVPSRGAYQLRFAKTKEDLDSVFRLRFLVFNLEMGEGLESAYEKGQDTDAFDAICDHLIVEDTSSGRVVGTYRLQTGNVAAENLGYYSAREFDFSPYEPLQASLLELGRASIHRQHRSFEVLTLLWKGIASYALERNARFLVGCSSLTSQCPQEGSDMYRRLHGYLVEPALRTVPRADFEFPIATPNIPMESVRPPKLLRAYLSIGAKICGPPAIDRQFRTIDFLTLLDLEQLSSSARSRFLSPAG